MSFASLLYNDLFVFQITYLSGILLYCFIIVKKSFLKNEPICRNFPPKLINLTENFVQDFQFSGSVTTMKSSNTNMAIAKILLGRESLYGPPNPKQEYLAMQTSGHKCFFFEKFSMTQWRFRLYKFHYITFDNCDTFMDPFKTKRLAST